MIIDVWYYANYDDMSRDVNIRKLHFPLITAWRCNKDLLRLYKFNEKVLDTDRDKIYIKKVVFEYGGI